jgi:3-oxoacyl-[acyl-carrier protein] reductase
MSDMVLITGASKGIGLAIARKLRYKSKVINISRTSGEVKTYPFDLSVPWSVAGRFQEIVEKEGVPDVLINCAGYVDPKGISEITGLELRATLDINFTSAFILTQLFVKYNKVGGKIINIASTSGQRASPGWSAYGAAKAALINFSLSMAEELKPYNIQVYCVSPGRCATDLRRTLAPDEDMTRIMQPEEVADFVAYLLEEPGLLSGQVINTKKDLRGGTK